MRRRHYLGLATATVASLAGCMGSTEYTITNVTVGDTTGPLSLDLTIADAAATIDSSARLDVTLRNAGDKAVSVRNTGIWPLGLLGLAPSGERGPRRLLLMSDQYAKTDRVEVSATGARGDDESLVRSLDADKSITEQYDVQGDRLSGPGTYTLRGFFDETPLTYRTGNAEDWIEFYPKVTIDIEKRSLLP